MKTMICIGDSLTEGTDIPVGHTWPALVANTLGIDVISRGIGGDTTAGMLARFYPDVVADRPSFVFILGGTNDLWWGWEVRTIVGHLFSMVVQARHHDVTPIIGTPLPVHTAAAAANDFSPPWEGYERLGEKMEDLCTRLHRQGAESDVPVVDLQRPFLDGRRRPRTDLFLPDGLHPTRDGHVCIADAVAGKCREHFLFKPPRGRGRPARRRD